ncbi:hypothetical protein BGW39_003609 [Mortierella sp. 14UC]|nr:hypothetical protein BGW39_003609 [Mortierella sp. 14UC]
MLHTGNPTDDDLDPSITPGIPPREGVQVVRLASRNKIVHVATHFDESVGASGKEIVLWDDVLIVFRDAAYLQHGQRVVPFLKGGDFKNLVPWRIAAIPGAVLDVIIAQEEGQTDTTGGAGVVRGVSPAPPTSSSASSPASSAHGRTPSYQSVAPQQRDPDAPPTRIVPPLIPKRPVQTAIVTLTPPSSSSSSSPSHTTSGAVAGGQANTARSPEYGLAEEAMAGFGHFDLPPEFLANLAAGRSGSAVASVEAGGRAPHIGNLGAAKSPMMTRVEAVVGGSERPLSKEPQQQYSQQAQATLTQPRGAPQIQTPSSSGTTEPLSPNDAGIGINSRNNKPAVVVDAEVLDAMISKARAGDTAQQVALGDMYREWKDYKTAMEWYLEAATPRASGGEGEGKGEGDLRAQYNVGFMYNYGEGVARNFRVAVEWYDRAAKQGDGLAGYKAGKLRKDGLEPLRIVTVPDVVLSVVVRPLDKDDKTTRMPITAAAARVDGWKVEATRDEVEVVEAQLNDKAEEAQLDDRVENTQLDDKAEGTETTLEQKMAVMTAAAEQGDMEAQFKLGTALWTGKGRLTKDRRQAKACSFEPPNKDTWMLSSRIGSGYRFGNDFVEKDLNVAMEQYLRAADVEDYIAQYHLGVMYHEGLGVSVNRLRAMDWYLKTANQGYSQAHIKLGDLFVDGKGGIVQDHTKAKEWFLKAAKQEEADAQGKIGSLYRYGHGVPQDYNKAMEWYLKAANNNKGGPHGRAQHCIAHFYREGYGVPQDYAKAMECLLKAAEAKVGEDKGPVYYTIGHIHQTGSGVMEDFAQAIEWYFKAAREGDAKAQYKIGMCNSLFCILGHSVETSNEWIRRAAANGNVEVQRHLERAQHTSVDGGGIRGRPELEDDVVAGAKHQLHTHQQQDKNNDKQQRAYTMASRRVSAVQSVQGFRLVNTNNDDDEHQVLHIDCHHDPSTNKAIVLWEDILIPFKQAAYVRNGTRVVPFLKGADFQKLEPLRIAAVPDTVLEVVVDDEPLGRAAAPIDNGMEALDPDDEKTMVIEDDDDGTEEIAMDGSDDADQEHGVNMQRELMTASRGDADAQHRVGYMYHHGFGYEIGRMYQKGQGGLVKDRSKALEWYRKAAVQGHAEASFSMGRYYGHGHVVSKSFTCAASWYQKAADQNHIDAQYHLGILYCKGQGGIPQDFAKATEWYLRASNQGSTAACHHIGRHYMKGLGVPRDYTRAMEWFLEAANRGHADSQFSIAALYYNAQGVPRDYTLAMEWYLKAAHQGHQQAQYWVGVLHRAGLGVPHDNIKAMEWFLKAAAQGYPGAQEKVGTLYSKGQGVAQDYGKALEWFLEAAGKGHAASQFKLAELYDKGHGGCDVVVSQGGPGWI